jgi:O-antigen ligase
MKSPLLWFSGVLLVVALAFGGAARQGLGADAIPELVSLPVLALAFPRALPLFEHSPSARALVIGLVALPCLQLIPLPSWAWSLLPGRQSVLDILATAGLPLSWRPISLIPGATWRALLSVLPAVTIFLAALSLDLNGRKLLLLLAVAVGVVSASLAMLQVIGGLDSGLYFYQFTNPGRGVGFFANANHFAAFEYTLIPLAAATLTELRVRSFAFLLAVFGIVVPSLLFGLSLSGSRSAVIIGALSLFATAPLILGPEIARLGRRRMFGLAAVLALTLIPLMSGLGLMLIFSRLTTQDVVEDVRWVIAAETWRAILSYFPFGSGLGTFPLVYPLHETTAGLIPESVNRAHDDLLETLLEGGLFSLALLLGFLLWLVLAMRRAMRGEIELGARRQARAGVIAIVLLLLHSLWDYPLRTVALESIFALCVALQFDPPPASKEDDRSWWSGLGRQKPRRRKRSRRTAKPLAEPTAAI